MSRKFAVAFTLALAVAACSDKNKQAGADSELTHDLALANQAPAVPQLTDTAMAAPTQTPRATKTPPRTTPRLATRHTTPRPAPASSADKFLATRTPTARRWLGERLQERSSVRSWARTPSPR